jgi:Abnormal spindle-like microcephaly-assoc'd, ASPM-SPD-2-Hydin
MHCLPYRSIARVLVPLVALIAVTGVPASAASKLVCSPCSVDFGQVQVGKMKAVSIVIKNSGTSSIRISSKAKTTSVYPNGLPVPYTLGAGRSVTVKLVYAPKNTESPNGKITYYSNATNPSLAISVTGSTSNGAAGRLTANPTSVTFGSVQVGDIASKNEVITNTGSSNVTISRISASGSGFSVSGVSVPLTLSAGHSVTFQTAFKPTATGSSSGAITVVSNATNSTMSVAESGTGTGTGALAVSPSALNFGSVTVGAKKSLPASLTANGASVTVRSASVSSTEYSVSGIALPKTLAAGQSISFTVTFAPKSSGSANANLSFSTGNSTAQASLQGSGGAATSHSVSLSWRASTSTVIGYNIYRGTKSGGPYALINGSPEASTNFADTSVTGGTTYYYVVTAVNSKGVESVYSNQAVATVPSP